MNKGILLAGLILLSTACFAQTKGTVRFDTSVKHQHITGFGGFVCSPQFGYGHMSESEIKKVWGPSSTLGCNIMRLYLPVGENSWKQSLSTAKLAKKQGAILFASPWGQPMEWKTNNSINAKNDAGEVGSLKKENWPDYAAYLEKYVQYLRKNGVELDAISIQNEPDWTPTYAGCYWSTSDMAEFVKTYGRQISCKIITPESIGCSDGYANALNKTDVLNCFDIYGGHQYSGIGSAYKNLAKKGKEIWMTEYLINWNENQTTTRNFDFTKDFFNFFRSINTCMLGDFNAWVHYASKRFYGMLGDGQYGTTNGTVTKRGYIMAHFAKFVTGMTRIDATLGGLEGSAFLSQTGDTIVAVMANATDNVIEMTFDLPFYTQEGELRTTDKSQSFKKTAIALETEACRPVVTVAAQSVVTVQFIKSRDRQVSNMKGDASYFDRKRLDDLTTTKTTFGTAYKISGKTGKKFDSDNSLISSRKNLTYGYIALDGTYTQLVMHINKVTTTGSLTAGKPTLYYVNAKGALGTHEYARLDLSKAENFDVVLDLSTAALPDGCIGLLSLTCDNTQSHLTINFGDVYLTSGNALYAGTLSGKFVADDSNVLEFSSDPACTSMDLTAVTDLPATLPWIGGNNRVVYIAADSELSGDNVVKDGTCASLVVNEAWGAFRPALPFTATNAAYTCTVSGQHIVQLPFQVAIPENVIVYTLTEDLQPVAVSGMVPANQPVLIEAKGEVTFRGSGEINTVPCLLSDDVLPIATPTGILSIEKEPSIMNHQMYNLHGQRVDARFRGLMISNGHKHLRK
jgi:glucuronoarabinoxylan endo-1,4-beta-xylanase